MQGRQSPSCAHKPLHKAKNRIASCSSDLFVCATAVKSVGGISEATGPYFESDEHIWTSSKEGEEYPFRFPVKPLYIRDKDDYVPMADLVPSLDYVKRWPPEHWTLAFQGNVHVLNDHDYELIEKAVRQK